MPPSELEQILTELRTLRSEVEELKTAKPGGTKDMPSYVGKEKSKGKFRVMFENSKGEKALLAAFDKKEDADAYASDYRESESVPCRVIVEESK